MNKIKKISEDFATSWEDFFNSPSISQEYWVEISVPYMAMVGAGDFYLGQISSNISNAQFAFNGWDGDLFSVEENGRLILNGPFTGGFENYDNIFAVTATGDDGEVVTARFNMTVTDRPDPEYFVTGNDFVTYSSDVTNRPYADFTSKSAYPEGYDYNVNEIAPDLIVVPSEWVNSSKLPILDGQQVQQNFSLGYGVKDIMLSDNPSYIEGATGSLKAEFEKLVHDSIALGVNELEVIQWTYGAIDTDGSHYILDFDFSTSPLQYDDLAHLVQYANQYDIDVYVTQQIQAYQTQPNADGYSDNFIPEHSTQNIELWLEAYETHILKVAKIYEEIGVDKMDLTNGSGTLNFVFDDGSNAELYTTGFRSIVEQVSDIFSGELIFLDSYLLNDDTIRSEIDEVLVEINLEFSDAGYADDEITVEMIKNFVTDSSKFQRIEELGRDFNKVIVTFAIQSREDAFTNPGYIEETMCTATFHVNEAGIIEEADGCMQLETDVDFALQARAYQGVLLALDTLETDAEIVFTPKENWITENILGSNVFPNIGGGLRNKPAETIVYDWFGEPITTRFYIENEQLFIELDVNSVVANSGDLFDFTLSLQNTQMSVLDVSGVEDARYSSKDGVFEFTNIDFQNGTIVLTTDAASQTLQSGDQIEFTSVAINGSLTKSFDVLMKGQVIENMITFSATTVTGASIEDVNLSGSHQYGEYAESFIASSSTLDGYFDVTTNIIVTKDAMHALSDRSITSADALDALRMSVGLSPQDGLISNAQYISADFNRDGKVTSSDALQILKYAVGLDVQNEAEWVFINAQGELNSITRSFVEYDTVMSFDGAAVIDSAYATGVLIGDVNGSYEGLIA